MPALLLFVGLILIVAAVRNTVGSLAGQLGDDLGAGYLKWAGAIGIVGALGYIDVLRIPSRWLLGLIGVVLFLETKGGLFTQLRGELASVPAAPAATPTVPANLPSIPVKTDSSSSSGGGGVSAGTVLQLAALAA